ncbi:hypothetical protein BDY17DRAFT_307003 [Neohortaea acidophila]|uniref:Leucine-rich repeat-containing protein 40 n=1 Tax=Neohortaea acidophila TaxID=245834 RepID=A0A6A6Q6N2_9PEZI|nr:uncharacterized protein BDY17DRAFT_307003 [Neohortaea acidophila]KAF2487644.1 hypothetical protein BDY17DRAFT_307003 [Neohortaea acidophila]
MDEADQPTTAVNKLSGIPRPTRLPVLKAKSSIPVPQRSQSIAEAPRPGNAPTKSVIRPPVPPFAQPPPPSTLVPRNNGSNYAPNNSTRRVTSQGTAVKPTARTNARAPVPSSAKSSQNLQNTESHDRLSSLDTTRSASRQGANDEPTIEHAATTLAPDILKPKKTSRPSLSDRTIESLQSLPSTPGDRRRSNFFSPESLMGPPPRPASSVSRNGGTANSRPGTSDGNFVKPGLPSSAIKPPASAKAAVRSSNIGLGDPSSTPIRRNLSSSFQRQSDHGKVESHSSTSKAFAKPATPSANLDRHPAPKPRPLSKTLIERPTNARASLSSAFGSTISDVNKTPAKTLRLGSQQSTHGHESAVPKTSSAALRQQIAAAKAAARKESVKHDSALGDVVVSTSQTSFDLQLDPFNQAPRDEKHILSNRINAARTDGKLNIAAMALKQIPAEVLNMYDAAAMEESRVSWAEAVDLTRFNAADNEIEELSEAVFPDRAAADFDMDDQTEGNQFAGLETLDLHGNRLSQLPIGMRRLERLTSLNLSNNRLDNSCLEVVAQISTLKDLKLGNNAISGALPSSIAQLKRLESLDVRSNRLLSLPDALRELMSLRVLNVSGNQLTALPMASLHGVTLTDIDASNNALIASVFPVGGRGGHPTLQILNVANNSLAALTFDGELSLPQLRSLDVSYNKLTDLPPMHDWAQLHTFLASENKIADIPPGFTALRKLRNVNFTGNELRSLDPEIARMDALESLVLASNPLRERKFLTLNAGEIKRILKARLEPTEGAGADAGEQDTGHSAEGDKTLDKSSKTTPWILKARDALDLSGCGFTDDVDDRLGAFLQHHEPKHIHLQSNTLSIVPPALSLAHRLGSLDLSGNPLQRVYLSIDLTILSLQELNISRCNIITLDLLVTHLQAPRLQALDISANRIPGALPDLHAAYPALRTLAANDNKFASVTAESLRGYHVVNLMSNDIAYLPPEVGLLWEEGLRNFEVGRNVFRVPGHRVLEKGTEATMRWLRDRLPAADGD